MASIQESRFLDLVPVRMTHMADALEAMKPRLVKIESHGKCATYINPAFITTVADLNGGVRIYMSDGRIHVNTCFKTAEEAVKALGMSAEG